MVDVVLNDFEYFKIYQPKSGYHFSSEPFVLTCNFELYKSKVFVDFGSGCGVIAVILALKNPHSFIYAIERNKDYLEIIDTNFKVNGIKNAKVVESEADIPTNSVDFFLSNPPYFVSERHRVSLKYKLEKFEAEPVGSLVGVAKRVLLNKGTFKVTFHPTRVLELIEALKLNNFGLKTVIPVYGNLRKDASFLVVESKLATHDFVVFKPPVFLDKFNPLDGCWKEVFEK